MATRRGVRSISTDDLIFLIRHDKAKVSRLRTFLSWKDVRKNVKDSDDKGGGDAADFAAADDAAGVVAGPQDVAPKPKNKRAKVGLAWDVNSFFSVQVPEREDEEDEEEEEQNYATLQRLAAADERTRHMTKEEYVFWSECRQASFTYRKSKRFREWAGFGVVTESKPNDDIVDILGFLTFEIVQTLTEEALKVKEREDNEKHRRGGAEAGENLKKRAQEARRNTKRRRRARPACSTRPRRAALPLSRGTFARPSASCKLLPRGPSLCCYTTAVFLSTTV